MRLPVLLTLMLIAIAGCTQSQATRIDERTFLIEGPGVSGGAEGPNRREASRLCPKGYRVLNSEVHRNGPNRYTTEPGDFINWTIRCL